MAGLICVNMMSLDGYYEGPGTDVTVLPYDDAFHAYNLARMRAADVVLLGATSYEGFREFWSPFEGDPSAPSAYREFSRLYNAIDKIVISDHASLPEPGHPWARSTRIVKRADAYREVEVLKAARNVVMWGSRTLRTDLMARGLLDELHLVVLPKVLGAGTPAFAEPPEQARLVESRTLEGSSDALLRYAVR